MAEKTEKEQRKLANLKRFEKGKSGNKNGRPLGRFNVSTILKDLLQQIAPDSVIDAKFVKEFSKTVKKPTNAHAAAYRILFEGIVNGESWALKELSDRTEGKPHQSVALTDGEGEDLFKNITIKIIDGIATRDK